MFRSRDGGRNWQQLRVDMVEDCPNVGVPRVTALTVDPSDNRIIWAGVEVDGVRRSLDGGETWSRIAGGLNDPDIHDVAVRPAGPAKAVLTSTPREIFASTDKGESWEGLGVGKHFSLPYCRGLALKVDDPNTVFVATGDGAAGTTGAIQRSKDGGRSWSSCRCRTRRTRRSGRLPHMRPIPELLSPAAITASFTPARMPVIPGGSCHANSPRSARSPGHPTKALVEGSRSDPLCVPSERGSGERKQI